MKSLTEYLVESRVIKNRKFMKLLEKAGFKNVHLEEDSGTVYVFDDEGISSSYMGDSAWYGTKFNDQLPEQWVLDIAIKYLDEVDEDDLKTSKDIKPNFDYLFELCKTAPEGDYYKKQLNKYKK